jgi:hypothetical protein
LGTTQVNAGSDLTANHIIQTALVIGGTINNPGLVTINASDASGNPLVSVALPETPLIVAAPSGFGMNLSNSTEGDAAMAPLEPLDAAVGSQSTAVPEPTVLLLFAVGGLAVGGAAMRRRRGVRTLASARKHDRRISRRGRAD